MGAPLFSFICIGTVLKKLWKKDITAVDTFLENWWKENERLDVFASGIILKDKSVKNGKTTEVAARPPQIYINHQTLLSSFSHVRK